VLMGLSPENLKYWSWTNHLRWHGETWWGVAEMLDTKKAQHIRCA
jgi:hypothetical protein